MLPSPPAGKPSIFMIEIGLTSVDEAEDAPAPAADSIEPASDAVEDDLERPPDSPVEPFSFGPPDDEYEEDDELPGLEVDFGELTFAFKPPTCGPFVDDGKAPLKEVVWFGGCCRPLADIGPLETPGLRPDLLLLLPPEDFEPLFEPFLFCIVSLIPSELGFTMYSDALPLLARDAAEIKPPLEESFSPPPPSAPKLPMFTLAPMPPADATVVVTDEALCWVMVISGSTSTAPPSSSTDCADLSLSMTALSEPAPTPTATPAAPPVAADALREFFAACSACNIELAELARPEPPPPPDCSGESSTGLPVRSINRAPAEDAPGSPPGLSEIVSEEAAPAAARSSCFSFRAELFPFVEPIPPRDAPDVLDPNSVVDENCSAFFSARSLSRVCSLDELPAPLPLPPTPLPAEEDPPSVDDFEPGELPLAAADLSADMLGFPPPVEPEPACSGCFGEADEVAPPPCFGL
uniref:Uncharacterized protein n=1 Tax=Anopheles atroparvus TaxID=41427 RepID=A0A182IXZ1_ANOAO